MANSMDNLAAPSAIPDYLEPLPMFPLGCTNTFDGDDFIMVAEFAEVEGPRPIKLISSNLPAGLDVNMLAMKVLPVDHHFNNSRDEFAIAKDMQLMMTDSQLDLAMLVHSFKLYDRAARGYVRPMCITYGSRDYNKMTFFYEELSKLCYEVVAIMEQSNREVFLEDMERHHADLLTWLTRCRMGVTEVGINQQQQAEIVEKALLEASLVIQCFGRKPDSDWKCDTLQADLEDDVTEEGLLSCSSAAVLLQKPSCWSLYGIDELSPRVGAAWKLLEVMHKYYSRTTAEIICHRNQCAISEPAGGLLLKGSEPLVNCLLGTEPQDSASSSRDLVLNDDASSNDYFYSVGSDVGQCIVLPSADNGSRSLGSLSSDYVHVRASSAETKSSLMLSGTDLLSWGSYSSGGSSGDVDGPQPSPVPDWRQRAGSSPLGGGRGGSSSGALLKPFAASLIGRTLSAPVDSSCGGSGADADDDRASSRGGDPEAAATSTTPAKRWPSRLASDAAHGDAAGQRSQLACGRFADSSSVDPLVTESPSSAVVQAVDVGDTGHQEGPDADELQSTDTGSPGWQLTAVAATPTQLTSCHTGSSSSGGSSISVPLPAEIAIDLQAFLLKSEAPIGVGRLLSGVLLRLATELRPFPILVHSLLSGRPVIVVADVDVLPKSSDSGRSVRFDPGRPLEQQLLAVVRALETLVPRVATALPAGEAKCVYQSRLALAAGAMDRRQDQKPLPSSQRVSDMRHGRPRTLAGSHAVSLVDVCQHKIIAIFREKPPTSMSMGSSGELEFAVAAENVLRHVTVLNLSTRNLRGPLYMGSLSKDLRRIRKEKSLQNAESLQLLLDRVITGFAMKAFVLYHSFNYYYFRDLEPCETHTLPASQYADKQRSLLRSMGLSPDDAEIVKYMASIVDRQQVDDYLSRAWGKCGQSCSEGQLSGPWMAASNKTCRVYGRRGLLSYFSGR